MSVFYFDLPAGDHKGLQRFLKKHEKEYGTIPWYTRAEEAIEAGDWDRAWKTVAAASVRSYTAAWETATPREKTVLAQAVVGTRFQDDINTQIIAQARRREGGVQASAPSEDEIIRSIETSSQHEGEPSMAPTVTSPTSSPSTPAPAAASFDRLGRAGRRIVAIASLTAAGLVMVFVVFVWPTAYRYDHVSFGITDGSGSAFPIRINRFTGVAEILLPRDLASDSDFLLEWVGPAGGPASPSVDAGEPTTGPNSIRPPGSQAGEPNAADEGIPEFQRR